jgi:hypothetical protein
MQRTFPLVAHFLQEKAREVAARLQIDDFLVSSGWLDHFHKRNNVSFSILSGESASADL